ncbi:MAG TPA: polyamine aminopropyltransferase [Dehalococcoidia bacterium]|nr:polyamine aminopropyltransferase [Dehalococcoidia bacterium]
MDLPGKWLLETVYPDLAVMLRIQRVLYSGKTAYQNVEVLESDLFGRSLVLDGKTQSTERDEHIYHEALVHPAMLMHPDPQTVFIGGGGEGATLREVLAHRSVRRAVMLDLDPEVVELCRRHLPRHHQGSFDDSRLELLHQDARGYLAECRQKFDVMVLDLVDPLEGGPAYMLYTEEFYRIARSKLNPGGILVTQSGPAGLVGHEECFTIIHRTLAGVYGHTLSCQAHVPAFQTLWGFNLASDTPLPRLTPAQVDHLTVQRIGRPLKFYDGESHTNMFALPKFLRQSLQAEGRTSRDDNPVFSF